MPELPEIEHLRRTLAPSLVGARIVTAELRRHDMLRDGGLALLRSLRGATVVALGRHGKQLLIETSAATLIVQLGMSGRLTYEPLRPSMEEPHCHATLRVAPPVSRSRRAGPATAGHLVFRDPRRFGALRLFPSRDAAEESRWKELGPDALLMPPAMLAGHLRSALATRRTPIKAALLDQAIVAGLGNIYVDEVLHVAGVHPRTPAAAIGSIRIRRLSAAIATILRTAVESGGSTIRDYRDGNGRAGAYAAAHRVYGRGGAPCLACGVRLTASQVGGRTTVHCSRCQPT